MSKGILYGVGVGPGDPELMTAKAIRVMGESDVIAVPQSGAGEQTALQIAARHMGDKPVLHCDMPMTRDKAKRDACHDRAADDICALLDEGKTVAFLTLGDPTVYSTCWYVLRRVQARGYATEIVPGVPSFCAAAAALGRALCEDSEMLHIIPASHGGLDAALDLPGSRVLMKAGKSTLEVRDTLAARGELANAALVERCGMEGQRVVTDLTELDEPTGYFSIILVKEGQA
ncbi:MAG TPA: precorrin-2 C(20)-methyltransferase [Candidatus Agathobaculum pullicola]|nr:precorrin-2 C(20)-methyltransferase [Candidatus Agathobaculum pullicola]